MQDKKEEEPSRCRVEVCVSHSVNVHLVLGSINVAVRLAYQPCVWKLNNNFENGLFHLISIHPLRMSSNYVEGGWGVLIEL